jgi:hypothetical protein
MEAVLALIKVGLLSRHLPGKTDENHEKPQSETRFEPGVSRIQSSNFDHSTVMFRHMLRSVTYIYTVGGTDILL